jgi:predicted DNA-binding transcriptional regulator YafY
MKKEQDIKRLTRIVKLLNILSTGKLVIAEAAIDLNVSIRTIQRDIRAIEDADFPIYNEKPGQIRFAEGFSLRKTKLNDEEASMLVLMADIIKPLGSKFNNSFNSLKSKVINIPADSPFYIKMPKGTNYKETEITKILEKGIETHTWINMTLAQDPSRKLEYQLKPLKLINYDGIWYLLGLRTRCTGSPMRKFRLENILEAIGTKKTFKITKNISKILDQSPNIWFGEKKDIRVVVKVFPEVAHYFKNKKIFPLQKITKEWKDGSLTIESRISNHREAIQIIMQWVPYMKIIRPIRLKEEIINILQKSIKYI